VSKVKALLGVVVFAGGVIAGALASQTVNPAPPESPWRPLPTVEEPAAAVAIADLLVRDDARSLAKALDPQLLQRLAQAIEPLVDIDDVRFTGATERQGDILAAYVAGGRAQTGEPVIVGVVFRVRDGKVVGVN
jgi:hypothetical protein